MQSWRTSQHGCGSHRSGLSLETDRWGRARGESRGFRQQPRGDHFVAYHLAPAITDFISDENRVCCNNDLEQTLTLLHSEWSKEIEPSGQSSTHHPLVVSNPIRLSINPCTARGDLALHPEDLSQTTVHPTE